jgi:hypothetical protein
MVTSKTTVTVIVETRSRVPQPGHDVRRGVGTKLAGSDPNSTITVRGVAAGSWKFTKSCLEELVLARQQEATSLAALHQQGAEDGHHHHDQAAATAHDRAGGG